MEAVKEKTGVWLREGRLVYELNEHDCNKWDASVQSSGRQCTEGELEAIAQLMSTAPELLTALEEMIQDDFASGRYEHFTRTRKWRNVVAKAKGEGVPQ